VDSQEAPMFHFLWEALISLVVGAVAKLLMPGKDPGGILVGAPEIVSLWRLR